jgi:hypothetical protein
MLLKGKGSHNSNVVHYQQCNSNVVKRGELYQKCCYITAMLLKGKRSQSSNVKGKLRKSVQCYMSDKGARPKKI